MSEKHDDALSRGRSLGCASATGSPRSPQPNGSEQAMRRDLFVYISGPMTAKDGHSIEENVAAGLRVYLDCLSRGIPAFSPHLSGAFPSAWSVMTWERWLDYDLAIIERCTHVLLMDRWESSAGACREQAYAVSIGTPVVFSLDELPEACVVATGVQRSEG